MDRRSRLAFTLIELLVVIAVIALLISILLPALASARRTARQAVCTANLQQFGRAYASYSNDFKEAIGAFHGESNDPLASQQYTEHPVIARQAKYIINTFDTRRSSPIENFVGNRLTMGHSVAEQYAHLVLIEYISQDIQTGMAVCPEDRARIEWHRQPFDSTSWTYQPQKSMHKSNIHWLPYSSSYQLTPSAAAYTFFTWDTNSWSAYSQGNEHDTYRLEKVRFGRRKIFEISYPSGKISMMDSQQRHFNVELFYAYPECRQPLLFWDSSVSIRATKNSNKGWYPNIPEKDQATKITYVPDVGFESSQHIDSDQKPFGYYRWTRAGLHGVDFGGSEIVGVSGEKQLYYGN